MGYISFNEKYFGQQLAALEQGRRTPEDIYLAKQLLKILDDLIDEGYTELNEKMEAGFSCVTRLRAFIKSAGGDPFPIEKDGLPPTVYGTETFELEELCGKLLNVKAFDRIKLPLTERPQTLTDGTSSLTDGTLPLTETQHPDVHYRPTAEAEAESQAGANPFLSSIHDYCQWLGYEENTAYVFMLRDALLPYLYYKDLGRDHIYPWIISRKFLSGVTGQENVDDEVRACFYKALEAGIIDYPAFQAYCKADVRVTLEKHPALKKALLQLLGSIKEDRILVIESGYCGTMPMMLAALDERVEVRLYTTAPYLFETYKDVIFCRRYEDIRKFETLYSQDVLLQYAGFEDGKFFVKMSADQQVKEAAQSEIKALTKGQHR